MNLNCTSDERDTFSKLTCNSPLQNARVPLLGFAAWSGVGKTTLLAQLIPILRERGLRIGLIKHGHHDFEIDHPGKDSYRLRAAGASPVMITSRRRRAWIEELEEERDPSLDIELASFNQVGLDLLLVEGFKKESFPKLELYRSSLGHPTMFPDDPWIIAVATDQDLAVVPEIPVLDINDPIQIANFIESIICNTWMPKAPIVKSRNSAR